MKYGKIKYVDKPVSRMIFGTAIEPMLSGGDADSLLDEITALGINTLDTARNYQLSEKSIGSWLRKNGNRNDLVIISKCGHPEGGRKRITEKDIREDLEISLNLLGTDYIDIYLLHRDDPDVPCGEIAEIMNALHNEGKVGAIGGSNWSNERLNAVNEYAALHDLIPFTVSSPNYGLAHQVCDLWGGGSMSIQDDEEAQSWYLKNNMPVIAFSSLGRGLFTGKVKSSKWQETSEILDEFACRGYVCDLNRDRLSRCEELAGKKGCSVSQIALAWLYSDILDCYSVVSTHSAERMNENIRSLDIVLSEEEHEYLLSR